MRPSAQLGRGGDYFSSREAGTTFLSVAPLTPRWPVVGWDSRKRV